MTPRRSGAEELLRKSQKSEVRLSGAEVGKVRYRWSIWLLGRFSFCQWNLDMCGLHLGKFFFIIQWN